LNGMPGGGSWNSFRCDIERFPVAFDFSAVKADLFLLKSFRIKVRGGEKDAYVRLKIYREGKYLTSMGLFVCGKATFEIDVKHFLDFKAGYSFEIVGEQSDYKGEIGYVVREVDTLSEYYELINNVEKSKSALASLNIIRDKAIEEMEYVPYEVDLEDLYALSVTYCGESDISNVSVIDVNENLVFDSSLIFDAKVRDERTESNYFLRLGYEDRLEMVRSSLIHLLMGKVVIGFNVNYDIHRMGISKLMFGRIIDLALLTSPSVDLRYLVNRLCKDFKCGNKYEPYDRAREVLAVFRFVQKADKV